ncbi:unnamed protein product, partial [Mesorhabditis spiculigera]
MESQEMPLLLPDNIKEEAPDEAVIEGFCDEEDPPEVDPYGDDYLDGDVESEEDIKCNTDFDEPLSGREAERQEIDVESGSSDDPRDPDYGATKQKRVSPRALLGDQKGRYPCYIEACKWRGNFRSVRCTHMRTMHPTWQRPPRYLLNRIARDGRVLKPNDENARYGCFVEGCPWRGQYRASRSNHIKSQHKDFIPTRHRAPNGGFVAAGPYSCHLPDCAWRGASRSTRAVHMAREHRGWEPSRYKPKRFNCNECAETVSSHKAFVDHMASAHNLGNLIEEHFNSMIWYQNIQREHSITFVKRQGLKVGQQHQILYVYCSHSEVCTPEGPYMRAKPTAYRPKNFRVDLAERPTLCCVFLRVVHFDDGHLTAHGCLEHTGHRLGTSLLRLSSLERLCVEENTYLRDLDDVNALKRILARLQVLEGPSPDEYQPERRLNPEEPFKHILATDELQSLSRRFSDPTLYPPGSVFGYVSPNEGYFGFGFSDMRMARWWRKYSSKGVCFDEMPICIDGRPYVVTLALVFATGDRVRVAAFFTTVGHLQTFVTPLSNDYPALITQHFGRFQRENGTFDLQLSEWSLLLDWANDLQALIDNSPRPADRAADAAPLAVHLDKLLEPNFLARWSPLSRNPLTAHSNPALDFAVRVLRERYLSTDGYLRIDQYVGDLMERVGDYNNIKCKVPMVRSTPDMPRQLPLDDAMNLSVEEQRSLASMPSTSGSSLSSLHNTSKTDSQNNYQPCSSRRAIYVPAPDPGFCKVTQFLNFPTLSPSSESLSSFLADLPSTSTQLPPLRWNRNGQFLETVEEVEQPEPWLQRAPLPSAEQPQMYADEQVVYDAEVVVDVETVAGGPREDGAVCMNNSQEVPSTSLPKAKKQREAAGKVVAGLLKELVDIAAT